MDIPLCEIVGRPIWLNLAIYFMAVLFIIACGILYIIALKTSNEKEQKKRYDTLKVLAVVGSMVLGVMIAVSATINEWSWLEKCDNIENFVNTKMSYLKRSFSADNIIKNVGDSLQSAISKEVSRRTGGLL